MIASIRGRVQASGAGWTVIEVGGVGMRVELPSGRVPQLVVGDEAFLHTSLVVREDALTLYGFGSIEELDIFGYLISVTGVGPRSALGVLSMLSPGEIARAVANEDEKPFRKASGIGPKTAKLIVVSLHGKLTAFETVQDGAPEVPADSHAATAQAVQEGLAGLGWSEADAERAVQDARDAGAPVDHAGLLRSALALLQSSRSGGQR